MSNPVFFIDILRGRLSPRVLGKKKKKKLNKIIAHLISLVAHLNINEYRGYAGDNLHDISMCAPRNGLLEL